jgi:serine/threonine protein kinase
MSTFFSEAIPSTATTGYTQIPYNQIRDETDAGKGGNGFVKKARWGNFTVAIKYLYDTREMQMEIDNLMKVFGGENIITCYGLTTNQHGQTGMVMDYCSKGTLCDYLTTDLQKFTWDDRFSMAQEIAKGLRFIHQQGLLHRDLHDCNILINDNGRPVIVDFGLARPITRNKTTGVTIGRPAFIPPERLKDDHEPFTEQGDIYSLGVILWEVAAGREPFHGMSRLAVAMAVVRGEREKLIDGTPEWYQETYTKCFAADPGDRPNIDLVVQNLTQRSQYCCISLRAATDSSL